MPALAGALFLLAVAGVGRATSEILRRAMLQHNTPPELQGRIGSVWLIQATVLPSLGNVLLGGATKVMAPTTAILAGGIVCLVVTVWLAVANRELWTGSESIPEAIPIE
jgi:ENTS family enterobactin (siderophore) exporter